MSAPSFSIHGKVVAITGGYGVIGGSIARGLAAAGATVALIGRNPSSAESLVKEIQAAGGTAAAFTGDVLDTDKMKAARDAIVARWGRVDALINAAGGNVARARSDTKPIYEVPADAFDEVVKLNLHGTVLPSVVFAEQMAKQAAGVIVTVSSMAAVLSLSGVMGYGVAKAGIDNFTKWMAVDLARRHGEKVRVNAIAPGFFVTTQNKAVLVQADGSLTPRSQKIIGHTPMGRFGEPAELVGCIQWLCSDAASFVTGAVIPIDGGFSADGGI